MRGFVALECRVGYELGVGLLGFEMISALIIELRSDKG
jgi:hypothetical protein